MLKQASNFVLDSTNPQRSSRLRLRFVLVCGLVESQFEHHEKKRFAMSHEVDLGHLRSAEASAMPDRGSLRD